MSMMQNISVLLVVFFPYIFNSITVILDYQFYIYTYTCIYSINVFRRHFEEYPFVVDKRVKHT